MFEYHVEKSTIVNVEKTKVVQTLSHFKTWPSWSPWLIIEPQCHVEFYGVEGSEKSYYTWDGDIVGSGKITLESINETVLEFELEFYKPFASKAKVAFIIEARDEGTSITWSMDSKLPFYLFFMKNMMKVWIGMDYERGLMLLKELLEVGYIDAQLELIGETNLDACYYVGIENSATLKDIGVTMQSDFNALHELISANNIETAGVPFSYYHKMDMHTTLSSYIAAVPVKEKVLVEKPFVCQKLEAHKVWKVRLEGEYRFLGSAWAMAMMSSRAKGMKVKRKPMGIERYTNEQRTESEVLLLLK